MGIFTRLSAICCINFNTLSAMTRTFTALTIACFLTPSSYAALALQNYNASKHHRFANDPAFIGSGYDWSGVARASNTRWVTMISATYFLTANHAPPVAGNTVIFHENNDPTGPTITRTVSSVTQIGTTDISIGRLSSAPGPTIAIYGIASNTTTEATFASSVYSDREVFNVGLNDTGTGTTQFRVGRNELDGFIDVVTEGPRIGDAITFDDDRGTPQSLGDDESYLQGGDSGAPMFVTSGSDLVLVGANWFIEDSGTPNFSGTSFLPNHIAEISAVVSGGGESITLVSIPEPSTALCLSLGAITLLRRRR